MAIVNDALSTGTVATPKYDGIWSGLPEGMSPAAYALANGVSAEQIGSFLSTGSTSKATTPEMAVDMFNNPDKYLTPEELAAKKAAAESWGSMYATSPVYSEGYKAAGSPSTAYVPGAPVAAPKSPANTPVPGAATTAPATTTAPTGGAPTTAPTGTAPPAGATTLESFKKAHPWATGSDADILANLANVTDEDFALYSPADQAFLTWVRANYGTGRIDPTTGAFTPPSGAATTSVAQGNMAGLPPPPPADTTKPVMGIVESAQTVQGQLGDILKTGNPLLEAAKARAMQTANARGLQNSSMAAQAGEEAMLAAAMPIAQQDASTWQKQALTNQAITNEFLSMEKGKTIDLEKAYAAFEQNNYRFDRDENLKRYLNDSNNSVQLKIAAMNKAVTDAQLSQRLEEIKLQGGIETERILLQQDYTTKQNLLQLKSNNFTNYMTQLSSYLSAELEPADKKNKIDILNQQYVGQPMPDGWVPPVFK